MEAHLQAVSILYRAIGILWLLTSALVGILMAFLGTLLAWLTPGTGEAPPMELIVFIAVLMVGVFSIFGLLHFIAGIGFKKGRGWARMLAVILAIFDLFMQIPFGTAVGIYTLWVCLSGKTAHLFTQAR